MWKNKMKTKSLKLKLFLIYTGTLGLVIGLLVVINNIFLSDYYLDQQEDLFENHYKRIKTLKSDEMQALYLNKLIRTEGIQSILVDGDGKIIFDTMMVGSNKGKSRTNLANARKIPEYIIRTMKKYRNSGTNYYHEIVETDYEQKDIVMVGDIGDNEMVILYKPTAILTEGADVATRFYIYIGLIILALGSIFILLFSNRLTRPIIQLNGITKKIANQDFTEKFEGRGNDEIHELGMNINRMSSELQSSMELIRSANETLKEDIKRKEAIDEMRKRFIASVSHEMKTPLGVIRGYTEGLKYEVPGSKEEKEKYYGVIIDETEKMTSMVMNLLELSNLESNETALDTELFNLTPLVTRVIDKLGPLFEEENIRVDFIGGKDFFVKGDEQKIEQVLSNYITNGIHHIDGERRLEVAVKEKEESVRVTVFNTGKLINQEELENIWNSFYKIDKARTRKYGGSGLGLSIVKVIMEKHHGKYGVSNRDNGVEFYFTLAIEKMN